MSIKEKLEVIQKEKALEAERRAREREEEIQKKVEEERKTYASIEAQQNTALEFLNQLGVKEALQEIRDDFWGMGEITSNLGRATFHPGKYYGPISVWKYEINDWITYEEIGPAHTYRNENRVHNKHLRVRDRELWELRPFGYASYELKASWPIHVRGYNTYTEVSTGPSKDDYSTEATWVPPSIGRDYCFLRVNSVPLGQSNRFFVRFFSSTIGCSDRGRLLQAIVPDDGNPVNLVQDFLAEDLYIKTKNSNLPLKESLIIQKAMWEIQDKRKKQS